MPKIYSPQIIQPTVYRTILTKTSDQTISTGSATQVTWDTVEEDPFGLVDLSASTTRVQWSNAPQLTQHGPVFYSAWFQAVWPTQTGSTGGMQCSIRRNGSFEPDNGTSALEPHGQASVSSQWVTVRTWPVSTDDYIEAFVFQNTGSDLDLKALSGITPSTGQTTMIVYIYWNG